MKVALVHDFLYTFGGAERVLLALHKLYPEAPIYTTFYTDEVAKQHFPHAVFHTSSLQHSALRSRPPLLLKHYPRAIEEWDFSAYNLVISSSGAFSHGIITGPDTIHISYCHSPMRYVWDWHAENIQERGLEGKWRGVVLQRMLSNLRLWDTVSAKRVDYWIANSHAVQERIKKYYRADSTVIYPPVDTLAFSANATRENFALSISRLSKNKHIEQIIEACKAVNLPLKIAGDGKEKIRLHTLVKKLGGDVVFLGPISETEKKKLLSTARCFIFASEDDFGIAPVEALASGTPVIGLGKGGLRETIKNNVTGILYPEQTVLSLTTALNQFLQAGVSANSAEIQASSHAFGYEIFNQNIQTFIADHA